MKVLGGIDLADVYPNVRSMRCFIGFFQERGPYFVCPINVDPTALQTLVEGIIAGYSRGNASGPSPIVPDPRIPNEVRAVDEVGNLLAKWSLADEYERRQKAGGA